MVATITPTLPTEITDTADAYGIDVHTDGDLFCGECGTNITDLDGVDLHAIVTAVENHGEEHLAD